MTALGKFLRTTTFKLTLVYLTVFAIFAVFLLAYFWLNTRRLITEQITQTVDAEIAGLAEQYQQGGIRRLAFIVESRSKRPGSSLYLLTTPAGEAVAGNIGLPPAGLLNTPGWSETAYRRQDEQETAEHHALVRVFQLTGGFRLLVGRDLEERERLYDIIIAAGNWSTAIVIVLGLLGGFFITRRVLRRVDAMTETTRVIMAGDLAGRLPMAGTGDELDRLALNLNQMLERIEALMHGLQEVSENIAHDLRTPLTRLHNRAEEALRTATTDTEYRAALEATLEESNGLIRTFNALLMIARAESGQARENMMQLDAAEIVHSVAELYEPLAEEKKLAVVVDAPQPVPLYGNRELISQALANLLDNAIKYAAPGGATPGGAMSAGAGPAGKPGEPAANEITVKAWSDSDHVYLAVGDRGPGIAEVERGRVVERFVRLDPSRTVPGSGLGLSLVSAVARQHGGELRLEDNAPGLRAVLVMPRPNLPLLTAPVSKAETE